MTTPCFITACKLSRILSTAQSALILPPAICCRIWAECHLIAFQNSTDVRYFRFILFVRGRLTHTFGKKTGATALHIKDPGEGFFKFSGPSRYEFLEIWTQYAGRWFITLHDKQRLDLLVNILICHAAEAYCETKQNKKLWHASATLMLTYSTMRNFIRTQVLNEHLFVFYPISNACKKDNIIILTGMYSWSSAKNNIITAALRSQDELNPQYTISMYPTCTPPGGQRVTPPGWALVSSIERCFAQ